jgi:hypothetical protein
MGRLVRKPRAPDVDQQIAGLEGVLASSVAGTQMAAANAGDRYLERMVKYIPAEIVGCSMLINAILQQAIKSGGADAAMAGVPVTSIAWVALIAGCLLTPLFCWYVREDGDAWIVNAVVSTLAFPFWAYLMGAVAFANHHDGDLAVILILFVTVIGGLVMPLPGEPEYREEENIVPAQRSRIVEAFARAFLPSEGLAIEEPLQASDSLYHLSSDDDASSHSDLRFGPRRAHGLS